MSSIRISVGTVSEIQKCISHELTASVVNDIKSSPVFALMLDESTDVTVEKHLSICVRYIRSGEPVTSFLANKPIDDGCSHTIVNSVSHEFTKHGIDLHKCVSLATDGAAAMMGRHTGVGKQMQRKYSPFAIQTHCVAHRLNLALVDSIKKDECLLKFRDKFNALYHFISASSARTLTLKKLQNLLNEPELTVKEPHSVRWLGLKKAVEAVYESYSSVLVTLSKFSAEKNPVAKGLLKYFSNYKVAMLTAFMLDIHSELARLSTTLQKQNLLFSKLKPLIEGTLVKISVIGSNGGEAEKEMTTRVDVTEGQAQIKGENLTFSQAMEEQLTTLKTNYVKKLEKNIKCRFRENDRQIFEDLSQVFEPITVCSVAEEDAMDSVTHLGELYGTEKETKITEGGLFEGTTDHVERVEPLLDPQWLAEEWPRLLGMIKGSYSKLQPDQLCKRIILLHKDIMPNCAKLASIALVMQLTSVECERSFSSQNRLKTKFRSSLGSEKLDVLLKISMFGPSPRAYDPRPAIRRWLCKKRRKGRLMSEYKPRPAKVPRLSSATVAK